MNSQPVVLEARDVSVQYAGTKALDRVSFQIRKAAVSALIGENGAGKSTLVKVLSGIVTPSDGRILLDGKEITLRSVRDADVCGIGIIHQELNLCPNLSVAENIFLGREISTRGLLDTKQQNIRAKALFDKLEARIDPAAAVGDLPLGQQQIVEIAKALDRNVRVLMMDEPTSALSAAEIRVLFRIIADLKAHGVAIVYISHRLEELPGIADSVSVLRDGRMVAESEARVVDTRWIVENMTGRPANQSEVAVTGSVGAEVLRVENVTLTSHSGREVVRGLSLRLHAGEIAGIYGLMGAGRTELLECLMGLHPQMTGSVFLDGKCLDRLRTSDRIAAGLAMAPEDRQVSGLVQSLSILANLSAASLSRFSHRGWLSVVEESEACSRVASELRIKMPGLHHNIGALSGGNQQKVVIAKCLLTRPKVLLLDEPTRGVDVGAKYEIHAIIQQLALSGMAVLFVSSELEEVRAMAHRILVMAGGTLTAEFDAGAVTDDALASAAFVKQGQDAWQ